MSQKFTRSHKSAANYFHIISCNIDYLANNEEKGRDLDVNTVLETIECLKTILRDSREFTEKEEAIKAGY